MNKSKVNEAKKWKFIVCSCVFRRHRQRRWWQRRRWCGDFLILVSNDIKCPKRPSHQNYICHIFGVHSKPQRAKPRHRQHINTPLYTMHLSECYLDQQNVKKDGERERERARGKKYSKIQPVAIFFLPLISTHSTQWFKSMAVWFYCVHFFLLVLCCQCKIEGKSLWTQRFMCCFFFFALLSSETFPHCAINSE